MGFKCGIVGLPNVGKSTLFNALTETSSAEAANYPFCTIEPNSGIVSVPDKRLNLLSNLAKSQKTIPAQMQFVDIAGLVSGASKGEGLGNKFLSHIREVDAIIHMIRCFDSDDIQNVNSNVDPIRDLEIIQTEMKLADLESIQKRLDKKNKKNFSKEQIQILQTALDYIDNDKNIEQMHELYEKKEIEMSGLLSLKPNLYVCNVGEESVVNGNPYTRKFIEKYGDRNTIIISAEIENQLNSLTDQEKINYMEMLGIKEAGISVLSKKGYELLNLETFFTSGPEESRAWTINRNCFAPKAAGKIHTDFEKGFIKVETISYQDFVDNNGWVNSKNNGKMRLEGKEYMVKDGDVLNFRFNT